VTAAAGCGGGDDSTAGVSMTAYPLSVDTEIGYFAIGRSLDFQPFGGAADMKTVGGSRQASVTFQNVAEGTQWVRFDGYRGIVVEVPQGSTLSRSAYCHTESGTRSETVAPNSATTVTIKPRLNNGSCRYLGFDRHIVSPNYEPDPDDSHYGSLDRENVLTLYIDNLPAVGTRQVEIEACDADKDPSCSSPFGIFTTLPDPPFDPWPSWSAWEDQQLGPSSETQTDANGDFVAYLVVKPGADPTVWPITVRYPPGVKPNSEQFWVRVSSANEVTVVAQ
jgi:hypothetical protein